MLLCFQFPLADIAQLLQVSVSTIQRRIRQYGLEEENAYSVLSNIELDTITSGFVHENPNGGQKSFEGYLRGKGIKIQRFRIRESLLRVDRSGVQRRFRRALHRREYSVQIAYGT